MEMLSAGCATLHPGLISSHSYGTAARLLELHSYQPPEFLVLPVEGGSQPYLDWLQANLRRL
jgi:uncharacterized protein involved in tolerance to divalent cations